MEGGPNTRDAPAATQDRCARSRDHRVLHLRRPIGATEGSASAPGNRHSSRPDDRRHGHCRPPDHGRERPLHDVPHHRQVRGAAVSRSRWRRVPRGDSRAGPERRRYFAKSLYAPDTFIVAGFNPGMPVINKPPIGLTDQEILCVIAELQRLGGTATVTLQSSHSLLHATGRDAWREAGREAEPGEKLPLLAPGNTTPGGPAQPPAPPAKKGA